MKKILLSLLFIAPLFVFGQNFKVISGSLTPLVSEKNFKVEFDFSEVKYYKENMSEEKYIQRRIEKKDAEDVNTIKEEWQKTKDVRCPDKFFAAAGKHSKIRKYSADADSKYTLIVKPQWIYPGWFGGVMKEPSKLNCNFVFVETANPSNVVTTISCIGAVGDIYPVGIPVTNNRIAEAFAQGGAAFVKFIDKKAK